MKSRYEISDHTQVELVQYARAADSKDVLIFENKADPDQAALVRAV